MATTTSSSALVFNGAPVFDRVFGTFHTPNTQNTLMKSIQPKAKAKTKAKAKAEAEAFAPIDMEALEKADMKDAFETTPLDHSRFGVTKFAKSVAAALKVAAKEKASIKKKPASKQKLINEFKNVASRAFHGARSKALAEGASPEEAKTAARTAYAEVRRTWKDN